MTLDTLLAASVLTLLLDQMILLVSVLYFALHGVFRTSEKNRFLLGILISTVSAIFYFATLFVELAMIEIGLAAYLHDESKFAGLVITTLLLSSFPAMLWVCDNETEHTALKQLKGTSESLKYLRPLTLTPLARLGIKRSSMPEEILRRIVQGIAVLAIFALCVFIFRLRFHLGAK